MWEEVFVPGGDPAPDDDQVGGDEELQVVDVLLKAPGVVGLVQVLSFPGHSRCPGLRLHSAELEVTQFQIGHQFPVHEQG